MEKLKDGYYILINDVFAAYVGEVEFVDTSTPIGKLCQPIKLHDVSMLGNLHADFNYLEWFRLAEVSTVCESIVINIIGEYLTSGVTRGENYDYVDTIWANRAKE